MTASARAGSNSAKHCCQHGSRRRIPAVCRARSSISRVEGPPEVVVLDSGVCQVCSVGVDSYDQFMAPLGYKADDCVRASGLKLRQTLLSARIQAAHSLPPSPTAASSQDEMTESIPEPRPPAIRPGGRGVSRDFHFPRSGAVTGGADPTPPQSRHVQVMGPPRHELHQRRSFPELRHMLCSAA